MFHERNFVLAIVFLISVAGCTPPPDDPQPESAPWTIVDLNTDPQPLDLPYEAVTVTEVARYTPPDDLEWPSSVGYMGQTVWTLRNGRPHLYACSLVENIIDEDSGGEEIIPATLYRWDIGENDLEEYILDPPPPDDSMLPIPLGVRMATPSGFSERFSWAVLSAEGDSSTRAISIEDDEPVPLPIIDSISYYGPDGKGFIANDIDKRTYELSPTNIFVPADRLGAPVFIAENYRDYFLEMPDGVTSLATNFAKFDLVSNDIKSFDEEIERTLGAELTGFTRNPEQFFFVGESPFDGVAYTYINSDCCVKAIPPVTFPDFGDGESIPMRITGYLPGVIYQDRHLVFAEFEPNDTENKDRTRIVALGFQYPDPWDSDPVIVWQQDVPNIFGVCTIVRVGDTGRPYILTLDPTNGDIKIFDPLLGSIRYEGHIELAGWEDGMSIAGFALKFIPDPSMPVAYIHDPNANEIIELKISLPLRPI